MRRSNPALRASLTAAAAAALLTPAASASLRNKVAILTAGQQVPPVASDAFGCARFEIDTVANRLSFAMSYGGLTTPESAAHIHGPADPGSNAGVVFPLPAGSPKVGVWVYPEDMEADILAGRMYVNVHTSMFGSGEIRGQIVDMVATLDGFQPNPPTGSSGEGFGLFNVNTVSNTLDYYISVLSLEGAETVSHIHGFTLQNGGAGVVHPLPLGPLKTGTWVFSEDQESRILAGQTYVNVHSDMEPGGEIRGQIVRTVVPIDGLQEVPPIVTTGFGCGLVAIDQPSSTLSYHVRHRDLTGSAAAAHIHGYAPPGVGAGVLHNITSATPVVGAWSFPRADLPNVIGGLTYFNVHTAMHSGGEIRGQIEFPLEPCPTDIDCSGATDFADILAVLAAWGGGAGVRDLTGDGVVDFADLLAVLAAWGPCP